MLNLNDFSTESFSMHEQNVSWDMSTLFLSILPFHTENIVFCCIGTDRSTGDTLGPLVGTWLAESVNFPFEVIGTLSDPLHALNLQSKLEELQSRPIPPFIVAIDACLGGLQRIGYISIEKGPLLPGKALQKDLPPIGDISVKGIVNVGGYLEQIVLQNTRLNIPFTLSKLISKALILTWNRHKLKMVSNSDDNHHHEHAG